MRRRLGWTAFFLLVFSLNSGAVSLTILYTNDLHVRLDRLESLGRLIEQERARAEHVLLFDAGDAWQDFRVPLYALWGAEEMVAWMNEVGYDAMALGNHELYWGADRLAGLSAAADFPLLCANLRATTGFVPPFAPYTMHRVAGLDLLIVGLITAEYFPCPDYPWLRYVRPENAVEAVLEEVEDDNFDLVITVGHLSIGRARKIVEAVPEIDFFFTGHSHEVTPEPVIVGETRILQAGEFGQHLGRLRLEIDPDSKRILAAENALLPTEKTPTRVGRGLLELAKSVALVAGLLLFLLL